MKEKMRALQRSGTVRDRTLTGQKPGRYGSLFGFTIVLSAGSNHGSTIKNGKGHFTANRKRCSSVMVFGSSPEIDFASCLPVALEPGAWVGSESAANSGTDDSGPGIGGADGGGWGDVLPPLSVACGGGDISASCGEVMLLALSDLTIPPVELDRCTVASILKLSGQSLIWRAYESCNGYPIHISYSRWPKPYTSIASHVLILLCCTKNGR
uniref:Uncharacterized protein n=1 Tax=Anopheles coluzzii TaxID=1518534 RepID=A0A8W7PQ23_ANOCL